MLRSCWWVIVAACWFIPVPGSAQQVTVTTPLIGVNDSFYEHINLGWGFQRNWGGGSWFLNFGGPMAALPPFGGYSPANDFHFGIGTIGNRGGFNFNLAASQGSNRSMTMVAPSVTMMNGARGNIFSGSIRPFVTGLIPVVGDYPVVVPYAPYPQFGSMGPPVLVSPLAERLERLRSEPPTSRAKLSARDGDTLVLEDGAEAPAPVVTSGVASTAERGDISIAEIRKLQAIEDAAKRKELQQLIDEARAAESAGQLALARIRYKQAAARAEEPQRKVLQEAAAKLSSQGKESK